MTETEVSYNDGLTTQFTASSSKSLESSVFTRLYLEREKLGCPQRYFSFTRSFTHSDCRFLQRSEWPSEGRCLLFSLRIRYAHLEIPGFPVADAH